MKAPTGYFRWTLLGGLLLLIGLLIGWRYHADADSHSESESTAPTVSSASAERVAAAAPGWVDAAGGVQKLGVRAEGSVLRVEVVEGGKVKAGALLLQLDDSAVQWPLRAGKIELQRQQQLRDGLAAKVFRLQRDAERLAPLVAQQAEPATELQLLRAQIADLTAERQLADTAIAATQLQQQALSARLVQLQIRAPAAGEVLRVMVRPGDSVAPGTPLLWFAAHGPQVVRAEVDERLLQQVQVGMRAEIIPEYGDGPVYAATVQRIARVVGPVQNLPTPRSSAQDDRVVEVVLALKGQELLIGQRVLVRILAR